MAESRVFSPGLALLAFALWAGPALGADEPADFPTRLQQLEAKRDDQLEKLGRISDVATTRSGFLSAAEAQKRYDDAVFSALMGDSERAALEFEVLIRSGAIASSTVQHDAEWYLAETLFDLGNLSSAAEAYTHIVELGEKHPFFSGAVRRLLELYGITGDSDAFYDLYNGYIATRRVAPNALVNYTVAKSLYRQKDWARAKSLFLDCCDGSEYEARAHYFVGTILVQQKNYADAALEFQRVAAMPVADANTREVVDLANLAFGRVEYELGDYDASTKAYLKVGRDSKYFADQLYELVWTFIKQGELATDKAVRTKAYEDAIRAVEIFLMAFPEHRYAAPLKVVEGHLHMKQERYESANSAYERVIAEYSPIRDLVSAASVSREQPRLFFERLAEQDALDKLDREGLPPFAAEMLYGQPAIASVVGMRRDLAQQRAELQNTAEVVEELDAAFSSGISSLGAFQNAYETLKWLRVDQVSLMSDLLALEEDYLLAGTTDAVRSKVQALQLERKLVTDVAAAEQREDLASAERDEVRAEQVRAVQSQAFLVEQIARDLLAEAEATEEYLAGGQHKVAASDVRAIQDELRQVQESLRDAIQQAKPLQTETTLRAVMGDTDEPHGAEVAGIDQVALDGFLRVRRLLGAYRAKVTTPGAYDFFSRIDTLWTDMDRSHARTEEVAGLLAVVEQEEIVRLEEEYVKESNNVAQLQAALQTAWDSNDTLGEEALRSGFDDLTTFFDESVMKADMGIVDVYWQRKVAVSDRIKDLKTEQQELLQDLNERFASIHAKLED
jgi:TolA-binding protein